MARFPFSSARLTRVSPKEFDEFGKFLSLVAHPAAADGLLNAGVGMILQDLIFDPAKGGLGGLYLVQDVDAVSPILQHSDDAANLSLDAG